MANKGTVEFDIALLPDGTYAITDIHPKADVDTIYIPDEMNGIPITELACHSFLFELILMPKHITIVCGDNIKAITGAIFSNEEIERVILPESLETIKYSASFSPSFKYNIFEGINYIGTKNNPYFCLVKPIYKGEHEYNIHPDTKMILDDAFEDCNHLLKLNIPEGVRYIGSNILVGCNYIKEITIPNSVENLKEGTFGCKVFKIKHYTEDGIDYLGNESNHHLLLLSARNYEGDSFKVLDETKIIYCEAFQGKAIKSIEMNDNVITLGYGCFASCEQLESVRLSNKIKRLYEGTFAKCRNLKDINLPTSLERVEEAFMDCSSITISRFPKNMTKIDLYNFLDCKFADPFEISISQIGSSLGSAHYLGLYGKDKPIEMMNKLVVVPDDDMNPDGSKIITAYDENTGCEKQYKIVLHKGSYRVKLDDGSLSYTSDNPIINHELDYYNKQISNARHCTELFSDVDYIEKETLDKWDKDLFLRYITHRVCIYVMTRSIMRHKIESFQDYIFSRLSKKELNKFLEKAQEYEFAEGALAIIKYIRDNGSNGNLGRI